MSILDVSDPSCSIPMNHVLVRGECEQRARPDQTASKDTIPTRSFAAERRACAEWLAVPSVERMPSGEKELAKLLNVPVATLIRWSGDQKIRNDVLKEMRSRAILNMPDIVDAMADKARAGSVRAMDMLMKLAWG